MTKWIDIGDANVMDDGEQLCLQAEGRPLLVLLVDGQYHVIDNICPHAGLPLDEGERRGYVLTCPFHAYAYNIKNGRNVHDPENEPPVRVYETRVEAGILQARFDDGD